MELSIGQIAAQTGVTSRTLRHYESLGLLLPSRVGNNGYRFYQGDALVRLQRILLLRDLGLGLAEIGRVLAQATPSAEALDSHAQWLREEQQRISRQIMAIEATIQALKEGRDMVSKVMFDGFDHTQHRAEVTKRWGKEAYDAGNSWWSNEDAAGQSTMKAKVTELNRAWIAAFDSGVAADSVAAQTLAQHHANWLASVPGTPVHKSSLNGSASPAASATEGHGVAKDMADYLRGLGQMYVADPRFAQNYGGVAGSDFVRDALDVYAANLISNIATSAD